MADKFGGQIVDFFVQNPKEKVLIKELNSKNANT